jgi:hypothetical protein
MWRDLIRSALGPARREALLATIREAHERTMTRPSLE